MKYKLIILLAYCFILINPINITYALNNEQILLNVSNNTRYAIPDRREIFDINITNVYSNEDTFVIRNVNKDCLMQIPISQSLGDDNNTVYDNSLYGRHGTLINFNHTKYSGWTNRELNLDGINDYIKIPYINLSNNRAFTIKLSIYRFEDGHYDPLFVFSDKSEKGKIIFSRIGTNNDLIFGTWDDVCVARVHIPIKQWVNLTFTWDAETNIRAIYLNGDNIGLDKSTNFPIIESGVSSGKGGYVGRWDPNYFKGIINDFSIYDRAFSPNEVSDWDKEVSDWTLRYSENSRELKPNEKAHITIEVDVPTSAEVDSVKQFIITAFFKKNPHDIHTASLTIQVAKYYNASILIDNPEKSGKLGKILSYQIKVKNLGNIEDFYNVSVADDQDWNLSYSPPYLPISPGESGIVKIFITVPSDARTDESDNFVVSVVSQGNPNFIMQVHGVLKAIGIYGMHDFSLNGPYNVETTPSSVLNIKFELSNLGSDSDTYELQVKSETGFPVGVDPLTINVEKGQKAIFNIMIVVPKGAFIGQGDKITVYSTSSGDPRIVNEHKLTLTVVSPFWEKPYVIFIIGIIAGIFMSGGLIGFLIRNKIEHKKTFLNKVTPFSLIMLYSLCIIFLPFSLIVVMFFFILVIYAVQKYDFNLFLYPVLFLLLFLCGSSLIWRMEMVANEITTIAYYFMFMGILGKVITLYLKIYAL